MLTRAFGIFGSLMRVTSSAAGARPWNRVGRSRAASSAQSSIGLSRIAAPRPVPLRSWHAVLEAVRLHYRHAIIECEHAEGARFFLGELAGVDGDDATLHYIQVNGIREAALTRVPLDDITLVRFDERYVNLFGRYALGEGLH